MNAEWQPFLDKTFFFFNIGFHNLHIHQISNIVILWLFKFHLLILKTKILQKVKRYQL